MSSLAKRILRWYVVVDVGDTNIEPVADDALKSEESSFAPPGEDQLSVADSPSMISSGLALNVTRLTSPPVQANRVAKNANPGIDLTFLIGCFDQYM